MFVRAALAALVTVLLLPSTTFGQSTAVVIRDDRAEFCLTLEGAGEWFWAIYDGPVYSSSAMDRRRMRGRRVDFGDSRGIEVGETGVRAGVRGTLAYRGPGEPRPNGSVVYRGAWRLVLQDRDSGREHRIEGGELLIIPVGCFDPGRF